MPQLVGVADDVDRLDRAFAQRQRDRAYRLASRWVTKPGWPLIRHSCSRRPGGCLRVMPMKERMQRSAPPIALRPPSPCRLHEAAHRQAGLCAMPFESSALRWPGICLPGIRVHARTPTSAHCRPSPDDTFPGWDISDAYIALLLVRPDSDSVFRRFGSKDAADRPFVTSGGSPAGRYPYRQRILRAALVGIENFASSWQYPMM